MTIPSTLSEERQPRDAASVSSRDKRGKRPPQLRTHSLLGSASEIQRDPLGFLLRTQQVGEVVRLRFLFSPELAAEFARDNIPPPVPIRMTRAAAP